MCAKAPSMRDYCKSFLQKKKTPKASPFEMERITKPPCPGAIYDPDTDGWWLDGIIGGGGGAGGSGRNWIPAYHMKSRSLENLFRFGILQP